MSHTYSFVLLTYNQEGTIGDSVRSALAQEGPPLEILVSDDCSTDGTFETMQAAVSDYCGPHKVVLNRNPQNLGVNRHLNQSIKQSSGEVIIAGAGDDLSLPERALKVAYAFEQEGALLAHSRAIVEDVQGNPASYPYETKAAFFRTTDVRKVATAKALYLGATCAWHKDLFRKYGPIPETPVYEDLILGFRAALEERVVLIPDETVRYRIGGGVTTTKVEAIKSSDILPQRERELQRELNVLRQRRKDLQTFGVEKYPEVESRLAEREQHVRTRLEVAQDGVWKTLLGRPLTRGLPAVAAELNTYRKLKQRR